MSYKIRIFAVGKKMPTWCLDGIKEYQNRLPQDFKVTLSEISTEKRTKNSPIEALKEKETKHLFEQIPPDTTIIALDQNGTQWDTPQLAKKLSQYQQQTQHIAFLIGGPDGMTSRYLSSAQAIWSLSKLTLPHPMVRVILFEQLYRAWSILNHHPYHK